MDENPKLALEMSQFIEERKKVVAAAKGIQDEPYMVRHNGWLSKVSVK